MKIITRTQWGARYGDGVGERPLPATEAYLHHSVTIAPDIEWVDADRDGVDDDEERAMRAIEDIGVSRFGSAYGFPYTAAFFPRGNAVYLGHDVSQMGAHTYGHNDTAVGFVLVGDYDKHRPTDAQLDAVAFGLVEFKRRGWLEVARLTGGHRDVKSTACPGKYAYAAIDEINDRAAALENGEDDMQLSDRVELNDAQSDYFGGLGSISVKGLLIYGAMGGFRGTSDRAVLDRVLDEVLEAEKRDLAAGGAS